MNEFNINGVTKKNLRFWTKISFNTFRLRLYLEMMVFVERGKTGVPGEKPLEARERTKNKLNPHVASTPGLEPGPHWWEASVLTTTRPLLPPLGTNQNYPTPAMQAIPDDESNKYINLIVHLFIICIFENIFLKCISSRHAISEWANYRYLFWLGKTRTKA